MKKIREQGDIVVVLLLFVVLGLAYSVVNPLHEATDELRHYRFVRYLVENKTLPVQGQEACRSQSHHPPLFYVVGAVATSWVYTGRDVCHNPESNPFWAYRYADVGVDNKNQYLHGLDEAFPWQGEALAVHIVRGMNVLIGAGVVWLTWLSGRVIWPNKRWLALGGTAFVAFNPMFLYMSGAINNDVIAALSGAAVLYGCVWVWRDASGFGRVPAGLQTKHGLILGLLFGCALMSKFNMAAVIALIELTLLWIAWHNKQWRAWVRANIWLVVMTTLVAGWWFVRNQILYGEPTGFQIVTELWGVRDPRESLPIALSELPHAWTTLWGRFGFGQIPLPEAVYVGLQWVVGLGLVGAVVGFVRRPKEPFALLLLAANVALAFVVLFNYMLVSPAGAMGRFFFPGLPALALLTFYGWSVIGDWGSAIGDWRLGVMHYAPRTTLYFALLANFGMLALALVALFGYLAPAYARPGGFTDAEIPHIVDAQFDGLVTLRGYEVQGDVIRPGEPLDITLYWEVNSQPPGNYLLFVHLIDEDGLMIAQRDTHPGLGKFPARDWRPGDRFVDHLQLYVPETAYTPRPATLSIGLYAPTYRLTATSATGESLGGSLPLTSIALTEQADTLHPNALDYNFGDLFRLVGYQYNARVFVPGDVLAVELIWNPMTVEVDNLEVLVQLVDESGRVHGESYQPITDPSPHKFSLSGESVPKDYFINVALLDAATQARHNIIAEEGHWINDHLQLDRIRVMPPK